MCRLRWGVASSGPQCALRHRVTIVNTSLNANNIQTNTYPGA